MTNPRIFVGTLSSGEAEFDECVGAVAAQAGVIVTHHIIKNQPEFEAHNMLWAAWDNQKHVHDLFVKIDADTVLNRDTALAEIFTLFENSEVTGAQIPLWDYFTDDVINGLNCFSPAVQFRPSQKRLFADHADFGHNKVLKGDAVKHLSPIGWHGKNPSPSQAFHFGFHRKMKGQKDVLQKTAAAWRKYGDDARGWALAGAASAKWWMVERSDYQGGLFQKCFAKMQNDITRKEEIEKFIDKNYGNIKGQIRGELR